MRSAAINADEALPDFPSSCGFFPCRCDTDLAALLGENERLCRELAEAYEHIAALKAARP